MANAEHLSWLLRGAEAWRQRRYQTPNLRPDLRGADLRGLDLRGFDLRRLDMEGADLRHANLSWAIASESDLPGADLRFATFIAADFGKSDLRRANLANAKASDSFFAYADLTDAVLTGADLADANLSHADLRNVDLSGAVLEGAVLNSARFDNAVLADCRVFGVSAWNIRGVPKIQSNLIISNEGQCEIAVEDIEVAQLVFLLLNNEKIRNVIDTVGKKGVLILGRFTSERKAILDAIRNRLREMGYLPMMFDFDKPMQRDFTETIKTLAGLSRFIIADITNPKSNPLELQAIVPDYMVPLVPIQQQDEEPFSMFADLQNKYGGDNGWILDVLKYDSMENLLRALEPAVVRPALEKADQLLLRRSGEIRTRHVSEYS